MSTAPSNKRVLVDFMGAGPIVAYRDPKFPESWVRYLGYGKSQSWPTVHEDYALGWMPLPRSAQEAAAQQTAQSSEAPSVSPNVVSAGKESA